MTTDKQKPTLEVLAFQRLQIHYVYTFMFSGFDWVDLSKRVGGPTEMERNLREGLSSLGNLYFAWQGGAGLSEPDPIDPFLALNSARIDIYNRVPLDHLELKDDQSISCDLRTQITLAESGLGTMDFCLTCPGFDDDKNDDSASKAEKDKIKSNVGIIDIGNLGYRRRYAAADDITCARLMKGDGEELYLFESFVNSILVLSEQIGQIFGCEMHWPWVEVDALLVGDRERPRVTDDLIRSHFQVPYPIFVLQLDPRLYSICFLQAEQANRFLSSLGRSFNLESFEVDCNQLREAFHKEILSLLFRSAEYYYADASFAERTGAFSSGALSNMCSLATGFLNLHIRSCLAAFPALDIETKGERLIATSKPANYLVPALIETVKALRMRWHGYVVSLRWIDTIIAKLCSNETQLSQILDLMIGLRRGIGWALSEPVSYSLSSGSLTTLYAAGLRAFRVENLQQLITERMGILDRLYWHLTEKQSGALPPWIDQELLRINAEIEALKARPIS